MAVRRSQNFLNQQRVDVPHLRSLESGVRADFDELLNAYLTGIGNSYVLNGFEINMTGAIGSSATGLQVIVAESAILHGNSDVSGTFFLIPQGTPNDTLNSTTNVRVEGSFTPGALNYVGIEFTRQVDDSTTAQVYFWNPTTENELTKTVPLAETLDYKFVITSSIWADNVLPLTIIETDSANNVLSVEDERPMFHRLGTPDDATHVYPWNNHPEGRTENPSKSTSSSVSPFRGGDKMIKTEKEWKDAVMSAIKEIKGTSYWYSPNNGGSIVKIRADIANLMMTGKGNLAHAAATAGQMNWSEDIYFNLVGSRLSYRIVANPSSTNIVLADNQVAYFRLVREQTITPGLIFTNGGSVVTSVGSVSWTNNVIAGDYIKVASADETKYYKILSVDTASQVTLTEPYQETSTGIGGVQAQYAWGSYETNVAPSTDRHIKIANREDVPVDEDTYWWFLRQDNGGAVARVYVRGGGMGELEQGESEEISDGPSQQLLQYIGSPSEATSTPDYTGSITPAVAEQWTATFPIANDITSGQAFQAYTASDIEHHYFWFNKDGAGGDPLIPGAFGHAIVISTGDSDTVVAAAAQAVIDALGAFNAVDNLDGSVTITNSQAGNATDASNIDVGGAFAIVIDAQGSGSVNNIVIDGENLTKSIKRLDDAIGDIVGGLTQEGYEENLVVVSGAPASDNEVTGPILAGNNVTIPLNSRNSDVQQVYTVGAGTLTVFLNGVRLYLGADYNEVGASGSDSSEIETLIDLEIDDVLVFRLEGAGVGNGGGGSSVTGVNLGPAADGDVFKQLAGNQMQFRRLAAGANISITQTANQIIIAAAVTVGTSNVQTYSANYTVMTTNDIVLGNTASNNVTFTLPDAAVAQGKVLDFKKLTAANTMFVKSVLGQTLDGIDIDAAPYAMSIQMDSLTIYSDGTQWLIR